MTAAEISKALQDKFGASIVAVELTVSEPWAQVTPEKIIEISKFLRDEPSLRFDFLRSLAAVDYKEEFELVYLLFSYAHRHEFKIKVRLPRNLPALPTVEGVWPAANWHEREAYDLMGITFDGHPDLRRILLPDDWEGHPLRKDYKEGEEYHGVSTRREYLTGMPELPTLPMFPSAAKTGGNS